MARPRRRCDQMSSSVRDHDARHPRFGEVFNSGVFCSVVLSAGICTTLERDDGDASVVVRMVEGKEG